MPDVGALAREHDFALTLYPESATRRSRMTSWRRTATVGRKLRPIAHDTPLPTPTLLESL